MFMTRSEYDRGVTTFSPEGRLFQVEYAIEAIKLGSTAIAILTQEGIVLAVERRTQSPLMIPSSMDKIMEIDSHVACAVSGLTADAQSMVEHGRVQAQNHFFTYNESMPVRSLTQSLCALSANFGTDDEDSMSRPFGVALLVAGYDVDKNGKRLDPLPNKGDDLPVGARVGIIAGIVAFALVVIVYVLYPQRVHDMLQSCGKRGDDHGGEARALPGVVVPQLAHQGDDRGRRVALLDAIGARHGRKRLVVGLQHQAANIARSD